MATTIRRSTYHAEFLGDVTALAAGNTATIDVGRTGHAHWMMAVEFYSDSAGATQVEPTAGTLTFTVKTHTLPNTFQAIEDDPVALATANEQVDFQGDGSIIKVSGLSGVSGNGATHFRLIVTAHLS